jgi:hypothetical protein
MPYRLATSFHAEGAGTAAFSGTVRLRLSNLRTRLTWPALRVWPASMACMRRRKAATRPFSTEALSQRRAAFHACAASAEWRAMREQAIVERPHEANAGIIDPRSSRRPR